EALADMRLIASEDPANDQATTDLSTAYWREGDLLLSEGRIAEGIHSLEETVSLRRQQYRGHPGSPTALRNYQVMLAHYAGALAEKGEASAEVLRTFDEVIALGGKAAAIMPSDVYVASGIARAYGGKAEIAFKSGDRQRGAEWRQESLRRWQDVIQRAPLDIDLSAAAGKTQRRLAGFASGTGNGGRNVGAGY
ncbi:MAG: hypothetical protein KGN84_10145, partial [Acidobacteriota bacterium]|nr:hypothetical protein [Acidobacteriota bacterium]